MSGVIDLLKPGGPIGIEPLTRELPARCSRIPGEEHPLTCREFATFIHDYLTGDLPTETQSAFEWHLSVCDNCVRYLAQYRASIDLGRDAFLPTDAPLPEEVPEDLVRAILRARTVS